MPYEATLEAVKNELRSIGFAGVDEFMDRVRKRILTTPFKSEMHIIKSGCQPPEFHDACRRADVDICPKCNASTDQIPQVLKEISEACNGKIDLIVHQQRELR